MVGFYDFSAAPLVPVGHQYPQSELVLELVQLVVVEGKIQLESAGAFCDNDQSISEDVN
jgi:hypothetical protein